MSARARMARAGFTIVEMLIAVGAVVLITLGIAKLFAATGDTVRVGRRVSNLNEVAASMQRALAADIAKMTRKGFLVIRNREVEDPDNLVSNQDGQTGGILLALADPGSIARRRRVDELGFYVEGQFTSQRDPLHDSRVASGGAARVYYGHGLRANRDPKNTKHFLINISDGVRTLSNSVVPPRPAFGEANPNTAEPEFPNRYASDWILLRHVTVLAPPRSTASTQWAPGTTFPSNDRWGDSRCQIGLQPAAPDVFRGINMHFPTPPGNVLARGSTVALETPMVPQFSSGAIDIAATDLAMIRARVLNAQDRPYNPVGATGLIPFPLVNTISGGDHVGTEVVRDPDPSETNPTAANSAFWMKQWMIQGLPAGYGSVVGDEVLNKPDVRMNCEIEPPDPMGTLGPRTTPNDAQLAFRRTDQMMLAASNFVPGCTEFIVEWSFGKVYPNTAPPARRGQIIWHGLERRVDVDGDGTIDNNEVVAQPYDPTPVQRVFQSYSRLDGTKAMRTSALSLVPLPIPTGLIHLPVSPTPGDTVLYSCFGYIDPTFPNGLTGTLGPTDPETVPWPWPKLLRITVGLVDPSEPTREYRYQFVFEVPDPLRGEGREYQLN